ncbi:hypothetical protein [Sinimarinibacterium flocculans]|uniref:hypothetical protein n=1 Tax=Sinimarinibacterium flocculans TaxID=985250 RepID=UPI00351146E1
MTANDDDVLGLIARDRKLDAIKMLRETRGLGLAEAKAEVERLSGTLSAVRPPTPPSSLQVDPEVRQLAQSGQRIAAIKLLRERNRLGLKQAKELLDATVPPAPGRPLPAWIFVAAVIAAAAAVAWFAR